MFSRIDEIIFPNRCEVIEIQASQRYIYPIFKNGSTSIFEYAYQQNYKILFNNQIARAKVIDVVLRDPVDRYISGFNTFVYNTKRENPGLDLDTIIYFAKTYLFLNRHYTPQLFWLEHLSKYADPDTILQLRGMDSIVAYSPLNIGPKQEFILTNSLVDDLVNDIHVKTYLELDNILLSMIDSNLTYNEIMKCIKNQHPAGYAKCIAQD